VWISARKAAGILAPVVSGEAQARALLGAGLAGPPLASSSVTLYDEAAVRALAARPTLDLASAAGSAQTASLCPHGLYVARLRRAQRWDLSVGWSEAVQSVAGVPELPPVTAGLLLARIRAWGRLPWVATLCGFVVLGGEITGTRPDPGPGPQQQGDDEGARTFVIEPPGSWFAALAEARMPTGPGGRPWVVWLPPPQ
jgi:hypothetical protein